LDIAHGRVTSFGEDTLTGLAGVVSSIQNGPLGGQIDSGVRVISGDATPEDRAAAGRILGGIVVATALSALDDGASASAVTQEVRYASTLGQMARTEAGAALAASGVGFDLEREISAADNAAVAAVRVTPQEFLTSRGVTDPVLQQRILDAGLDTSLLDPDVTPATLARFDKLFPDTINASKNFSGRLGNIDTRVATINQAAKLEQAGLIPRFEFPVDVGGGQTRFVDLAGIDSTGQQATQYFQFVKMDAAGNVIRADELIAQTQIEKALNLPPGTVQLINTAR
jgi:hypothetical protein